MKEQCHRRLSRTIRFWDQPRVKRLAPRKLPDLLFPALLLFISCAAFSQSRITGKVSDSRGLGLPGATVLVVGTNNFGVTDSTGHFTLAAKQGDQIQISFLGYEPVHLELQNEKTLDIILTESLRMLDEVVVVGYGSVPRGDVTGAVASISAKDFLGGNITTSLQQVQGKIPGLVITQPGGDPNGDFNVRIRGATSLEGQPPLLVIDGVAIDDFHRAITTLNPADVASYDILKDAAAAAIYGSRGANGVILITTKKGKNGTVTIDYNGYGSVEVVSNRFDVLSDTTWREATASDTSAAIYDLGANTDWQKEITRTAYTQSHVISATGGNDQIRIRGSVGYINQQGVVINTGKRVLTARLNADFTSPNKKLNMSYGVNTSVIDRDMLPDQTSTAQVREGGAWVFSWAQNLLPVWPVYNPDGSYFIPPIDIFNPVGLLHLHSKQKQNFFQTTIRGDYELVDGLKVGAMGALSNGNDLHSQFWPPRPGTNGLAWGGRANANKQNFTGDLHANFRKQFGEHLFDVTAVYEYNKFSNDGFGAYARTLFVNGLILPDNLGSATDINPGDVYSYRNEEKIISFLGRLMYSFRDRYILTANFRRDGSSKFGANNRWGNFPSASIAWRITDEGFMAGVEWMDVKLRASYGLTGNQQNLPPNNYQSMYSLGGPYVLRGQIGQSLGILQEGNPDLKWEVRKSLNFGVDFSLWKDRINGSVDIFSDKTSDMLFLYNVPQPPFVSDKAYANAADATNKGIEIFLGADVVNKSDFKWNARVNFGAVRNRITSLLGQFLGFDLSITDANYGWASGGSFQGAYVTELKAGYPAGVFKLPEHAGFDEAGNELFITRDGEGHAVDTATTFTDDDLMYIDPTPDFEWGLTNTINFRNFDLSVFIRGVQGSKIFANSLLNLGSRAYLPAINVADEALTNGFVNAPNISTYWLQDGSFARLENVTLGYTLNKIRGMTRLRVYIVGRNLFLLTNYGGIDPEVNVEGSQRYIDWSYYPKTRSFTIGLDLSF